MKKGCFILFILLIGIVAVPILISIFFPEKPATSEKIAEVLDKEYKTINDKKNIDTYIELLDFLQIHKNLILSSFKDKEATECQRLFYVSDFSRYIQLPKDLLIQFQEIISKDSDTNTGILICDKRNVVLKISERTDYSNYLSIVHELRIVDSINRDMNFEIHKIKLIRDKYEYVIGINDVFHIVDPNNFAPN